MRTSSFVMIAVLFVIPILGAANEHEKTQIKSSQSRAEVAASVQTLREEVRKLSDEVRELVALLKSPDKPASPLNNEPQAVQNSDTSTINNPLIANVNFRDISLAEAKTLAMNDYRNSDLGKKHRTDAFEQTKDEQMLLKSVEDNYWDLWNAYRAYDARKKQSVALLNCWKLSDAQLKLGTVAGQLQSKSLADLCTQIQGDLHATLNGSDRVLGVHPIDQKLRSILGLARSGPILRPTDMPITTSTAVDLPRLMKNALKGNVWLKQKRTSIEASSNGKLKAVQKRAVEECELMLEHEVLNCFSWIQANYHSISEHREQCEATVAEIAIYEKRLGSNPVDKSQLIDNVARAHERLAQAEQDYHQHISEYNKALANAKYLCGQLAISSE